MAVVVKNNDIRSEKVQGILDTVENTQVIDTKDINRIIELQDLFNVTAGEARYIMQEELGREERGRLLWIITTIAGYDAFEFWFKHGMAHPWADEAAIQIERDVAGAYQDRRVSLLEKEQELDRRESDLMKQALDWKNELEKREADIRHREGLAEIGAERRAGNKVKMMREQLRQLQERLEKEQALNRKAKRLARLVEKI